MRIEDLTEQWLADSLGERTVRELRYEPLGTGQVADTYRVSFTGAAGERDSVVLKVTASDPLSAETGAALGIYLREVRYYQALAPDLEVSVPACLRGEIDDDGADFALLLEDLAPCRAGDQLEGCSVGEAALALREIAKLHAPWWGREGLEGFSWLPQPYVGLSDEIVQALRDAFDGFRERYADVLDEETVGIGQRFFDRLPDYLAWHALSPMTIQHGDFRLDNLLFEAVGGQRPIVVVDWQTVQRGPGMMDVSYFLGGCLTIDERRSAEKELVEHYHDQLMVNGVRDYPFPDCWRDYVRFSFQGYLMGVTSAMMVERTERGDRLFVHMVRQAARHIADLDAISHLA